MSKKVKTNMVTRRVVESRSYDVYEVLKGEFKLLGAETITGRVNEVTLAEKYKVAKVVTIETAINKKVYGVPVDEFMKIAIDITADDNDEEPADETPATETATETTQKIGGKK